MSDVIEIPKVNEEHDNYPCWIPTEDSQGNKLRPIIKCKCGAHCGIRLHHVHADGRVTASFYHRDGPEENDNKGCGWHVYLKLKDYDRGEFKPGL